MVSPTVITGIDTPSTTIFTGYIAPDLTGAIGSIESGSFEYGGSTYTIRWLHHRERVGPDDFRIRFSPALPTALQGVEVRSGSHTFALEDADPDGSAGGYRWVVTDAANPFQGKAVGDTVEFTIVRPAGNTPPAFADTLLTRTIEENTAANMNVGAPVTATDADGDALSYSLEGTDASSFTIDMASGQIKTKTGVTYDYEVKSQYAVTVTADDGNGGTDMVRVQVSLTDVDESGTPTVIVGVHPSPVITAIGYQAPGQSTSPYGSIENGSFEYGGTTYSFINIYTESFGGLFLQVGFHPAPPAALRGQGGLQIGSHTFALADARHSSGSYSWALTPATDPFAGKVVGDSVQFVVVTTNTPRTAPPAFADTLLTRTVEENAPANTDVGAPVTATDADGDALSYSLAGTDAASFTIDAASGQIKTKTGVSYDYEVKSQYPVTVTVIDGKGGTDMVQVRVNLTDVNEQFGTPTVITGVRPGTSLVGYRAPEPSIVPYGSIENGSFEYGGTTYRFTTIRTSSRDEIFDIRFSRELPAALEGQGFGIATGSLAFPLEDARKIGGVQYEWEITRATDPFAGKSVGDRVHFTFGRIPPATPSAPSVTGSHQSLDVSWTEPDQDGRPTITGYAVQYRRGTSGGWLDHPHTGLSTSTKIPNLPRATEYQVRVRAESSQIDSEWSLPGTARTREEGVALSPASLDLNEGGTATYTVVLILQPTGPVTVTPAVSGSADVTVSPASLTFTASNWNRPQTVTVSAAHDAGSSNDFAVISHRVTGANYSGVTPDDVRIRVEDDDLAHGTIATYFAAVTGPDDKAVTGGPLPDMHFGEPFQLHVGFRLDDYYVLLTGRCVPNTRDEHGRCDLGPGPQKWMSPGGALQVTGADVRFIRSHYSVLRLELTPTGHEDVTVTLQPLPCPAERAMCAGSNGLADPGHLTVRGVSGVPEAPHNVRAQPIYYNQNAQPDIEVTFDLDPVGIDYTIQYQRAGLAWGSYEEETGWRGLRRSGREREILFDVAIGQSYDVRVRWENPNGAGPWTTLQNVGKQGNAEGPPEVERIERYGDRVWIFFTRDLDVRPVLDDYKMFEVHYSESTPVGNRSFLGGEYVNERDAAACTSNGQKCRIVRLTLPRLERGGRRRDAPSDEETVSVSYRHVYGVPNRIRAVGEWYKAPQAPEFTRVVAELVGTMPALRVADAEGREGSNPEILFSVTLAPTSTEEVTVSYATQPGTATAGADYTHTSGSLTFAPGEWRKTVDVRIADDEVEDSGETFELRLFNASGADIADNLATGTILNREKDTSPLTASFSDMPATHTGAAFTFGLEFSEEVELSYETLRDDALEVTGGAVQAVSRQQQGSNRAWNITVEPGGNDDVTITLPETTDCDADGAICTDDGRPLSHALSETVTGPVVVPALSVSDASATEGKAVEFTVSLSEETTRQVTVEYATSGGTATSGTDFTAASGTLAFAASETSKTVSVATTDDSDDEGDETFTLTLSSPAHATLGDGAGTGEIIDNDVSTTPLTASFSGMPSSHTGAAFTFGLTFSEEVSLSYETLRDDPLGVTGGAVEAVSRQQQGSNRAWNITVEPGGDDDVTITLPETTDCDADGAICTDHGRPLSHSLSETVTGPVIVPALSVSDASATEGEAVEFTVSLSATSSRQVTVGYATSGGTATSGTDFTASSGTLEFAASETSKTVSVATTDDSDDEGDETFTLTLSSPAHATLGDGTATGEIIDDDEEDVSALTASFSDMPASHTGAEFTFGLTFSEEVSLSYETLRDDAFAVTGGEVRKAKRQQQGSNMAWNITVGPTSATDTVTITLPETTDCDASGAICTDDGRPLSHSLSATVEPAAAASASSDAGGGDVVDEALALLDGVTPDEASAALFGEGGLSEAQLDALDRLGNRNGRYDLGDVLSWRDRCRTGEARCGGTSSDPGPASSALLFGAAAAGRRRTSGRTSRRGRGRRRTRGAACRVAVLLAAVTAWSCTGDLVGPPADEPDPGAPAAEGPGFLTVEWTAPDATRAVGVLLELEGRGIEAVEAPGLELYQSGAAGRHQLVVAGSLDAGPLVRFRVPDRARLAEYRVRVLQVTGEDYGLRDVGAYRAAITSN